MHIEYRDRGHFFEWTASRSNQENGPGAPQVLTPANRFPIELTPLLAAKRAALADKPARSFTGEGQQGFCLFARGLAHQLAGPPSGARRAGEMEAAM